MLIKKVKKNLDKKWVIIKILSDIKEVRSGDVVWYELSVRLKRGDIIRTERLICDNQDSVKKIKIGSKINRYD